MRFRRLPALGLTAAALVALTGCATSETAAGSADDAGLSIVAATTQMADFTGAVVGDAATVTQLLQPNMSAHSFDPSPDNLRDLGQADVLVMNGAGLEPWLGDAVEASGFDGLTIDASSALDLADADPHIWTSIRNAETIIEDITRQLEDLDPANADAYADNAAAYTDRLTALDQWATAQMERVPAERRLLVSNHDSLGYFLSDYGITHVGSVLPSFDDNAELSAEDITELTAKIRASGATAVYSEASLSPKSAEAIAREAGVQVFTGEQALYVDSLGPAGSPADTYIDAQVHNISQILLGWGVTPDPVPQKVTE